MTFPEIPEGRVPLDERGYLVQFDDWTPAVAAALATSDGIRDLTEDHWRVIEVLRAHHRERGTAPMIRELCRKTGFTLQHIYDLFPKGPAMGACRVAGLPRPDTCV